MSHSRSVSFLSFRKNPNNQQQSLPSPPRSPGRRPSTAESLPPTQLHPEIRSVVQLTSVHTHKVYYSGPLVRRIERLPDGHKPTKEEGWIDIWAQLCGTTLNVWDMKQVQEASKQGREVPPTYLNMTDAFIHVLGAVTVPETSTSPAKRYTDILAVNTAGSNVVLFSCPSREALISWVAALRLSSWEKSRLEEIYTAHLIRTTLQARDIPTSLVRGKLEGWARIRISGQTDWKRLWMAVQAAVDTERTNSSGGYDNPGLKKKRVSLFSWDHSPALGPAQPMVSFYLSHKPKDKKKPLLTMHTVTQAFAVYPERPELIDKSTLIKLEGHFADEDLVREMKNREGWLLVMPELEGAQSQLGEMLKWIIALHDAFGLYGRPHAWSWDPRERSSMMFGYPVGPQKETLFLDCEAAETLDPRDDRTSAVRSSLQTLLSNKMQNAGVRVISPELGQRQPTLQNAPQPQLQTQRQPVFTPQLPPLSFGDGGLQQKTPLATVVEDSGRNTPVAETVPINPPQNATSSPPAQFALPSPVPSSATNHAHERQASIASHTPSKVSSPRPSSPPVTSVLLRSREDSITRSSFSSGRDKSQPMVLSASQSTADDRPASRTSILTSPHSVADRNSVSESAKHRSVETMLPLASPYSPVLSRRDLPPIGPPPDKALPTAPLPTAPSDELSNIPGVLYYMSNSETERAKNTKQPATRVPTTIAERDDTDSFGSEHEDASPSVPLPQTSSPKSPRSVPLGERSAKSDSAGRQSPTVQPGLRRKPSGARELGTGRSFNNGVSSPTRSLGEDTDNHESMEGSRVASPPVVPPQVKIVEPLPPEDSNLDVLAALSYLDVSDTSPPTQNTMEPLKIHNPEESTPSLSPAPSLSVPIMSSTPDVKANTQYRSSFAPSKQAVERKAKVQAQQIAHNAAVHKPGRLNGKRKSKVGGAWNESSDEEEDDDDDDEDDDADSDDDGPASNKQLATSSGNASSTASIKPPPNLSQTPHHNEIMPEYHGVQPRGPRNLPQVPSNRPHGDDHVSHPRRLVADQYPDTGRRPNYDDAPIRSQSEFPHPGAQNKSMWSQVLDPGRAPGQLPEQHHHGRDTFIQLEHPSETMTKAFAPQGLLSAGLQDKQDRSAKRQEELARETGVSLINVPNKPPPPQTGLLGAITAHERERKREGGMGAALTEREREKRLAEERQRRFDEQQRQQLEQLQQGGSMYGQYPGFNPMMMNPMMNPMMMGMNPMMTGMTPMMTGGMAPMMTGYPSMMPGLNPQQLFAAQQAAAQAYQQAMVAFSTAGSQVGGGDNSGAAQPMVPNTTGNMHFMGGYDPRMSMASMGMMGPQMGMPLGMQMTGMSAFDPRFPMNTGMNDGGLQPPNAFSGQNTTSRSSSPARRDSPAARPDPNGEGPRGSRPTSPKP